MIGVAVVRQTGHAELVERAARAQIVVVGAGPAGLVTSIVLARYGISVRLVDKREPSPFARALAISMRSMEIFRSWGVEEEIRAGTADVESRAWVAPTLATDGVAMPLGAPTAAEAARVSPSRPAWGPQTHVEAVLLRLASSYPELTIERGVEVLELRQSGDAVILGVRDRSTRGERTVSAAYVVGADGAHSLVRGELGLMLEGPDDLAEFHRVEFTADLTDLVAGRRYGLYVLTHPDAQGVLALRGPEGQWGFNREWRPGEVRMVDQSDDWVRALLRTALGDPTVDLKIERSSAFAFAAQLADHYRAGRGFLVGDAAHRMTPRGGTGMNTAIQDGFDLGWKLAWVLLGWADPDLLETYETERRIIGEHNVLRSAQPDGARRETHEILDWDLAGRVPHHWIDADRTVSTLDLVGPGLTRLFGPMTPAGIARPAAVGAPVTEHRLDSAAADALGLPYEGDLTLRPDAKLWDPPPVDPFVGPKWPLTPTWET